MMDLMQASAYCPTQRKYAMTLTNSAYQTSVAGGSGYQSLYSEERRDLDLLNVRKETFIFYPKSSILTADIAAAGFYYTGEGHVIRCFCCKLTVTRLNSRDNPFTVHRTLAPNCPFVTSTVTQGGEPGPEEDTVDGPGSNTDSSLPSDVEDDGPLQADLVPRDLPDMKDLRMTATPAKPLRPSAPISKSSSFSVCKFSTLVCQYHVQLCLSAIETVSALRCIEWSIFSRPGKKQVFNNFWFFLGSLGFNLHLITLFTLLLYYTVKSKDNVQ